MPTQYSKYRVIRYGILGGVSLAIALVIYAIVEYPSALTLSPVESIVFLALCVGLLSGYSWLAWRRTQPASHISAVALSWGGWLGLALGLCWLIELWAGNLANPSTNAMVLLAYRGSTIAVPLLTIMTAFYASRHTGSQQTGIWVGIWSSMISALITFAGLMGIAYLGGLTHDPQTIQQALSNGTTNIMAYSVADSLAGAINHLWIGPLLGILFGAIGGFMGIVGRQKNTSNVPPLNL